MHSLKSPLGVLTLAVVLGAGGVSSPAASIMLVTDRSDLEQGASGLAGYLRSLGYDVEVSASPGNASEFQTLDAAKLARLEAKDLVIVHRATTSGSFNTDATERSRWNNLDVPLVLMSSFLSQASRWNWVSLGTIARAGYTNHELVAPTHPILSGLGSNYFAVARNLDVMSGTAAGNGAMIARAPGGGASIVVYPDPAGGTRYFQGTSGETYRQRRTFCSLHNYHETGAWTDISGNGNEILARVVRFTMTGSVGPSGPAIVNLSPTNGTPSHPYTNGLTFGVTSGETVPTSGIWLTLNGADVTAQLVITGSTTNRAVVFHGLVPETNYSGHITASNALGVTTLNFGFDTFAPDLDPPTISRVDPPAGTVTSLTQITITFSEPVTGVGFSDLLINGIPTDVFAGSEDTYTFAFAQPVYGLVAITWDIETQIADLATVPNLFDTSGPGATWQYTLRDATPPTVLSLNPPAGLTLRQLTRVSVLFTEPVAGVDAQDLLINGAAATSVSGGQAGPYVFQFPQPATGLVQVAWASAHGITDTANPPNPFAGGDWTCTLDPNHQPPEIRLNEILAATLNTNQLSDEDGELQDWIELHNHGSNAVNLLGWSLTDDPQDPDRWIFPDVMIGAGQYLVVFASAKDRKPTTPGTPPHTNFKLSSSGEFLGLYNAESPRVAVATLDFPEQRNDHSYGYDSQVQLRYFATPTPGGPNGVSTIVGVVPPVHFSVGRGVFDAPFTLHLTTPQTGATIRYTADGSEPSATAGQLHTGPMQISGTTILRAAAFAPSFLPSAVGTHTYLFLEPVIQQPANPPGVPTGNIWGGYLADYAMDPEVTTNAQYAARMKEALQWLPVMSIVMNVEDIFGVANGIYTHPTSRGDLWERACSTEFFFPDGRTGFQVNCGIQIQGNANRTPGNQPKHSFRLMFKGDYGPAKLEYKMFPDSPMASFNTLVLRADYNNSWPHWDPNQRLRGQRTRDAFMKDTMRDMGGFAGHSRFVHLYINGLYWGVYDPTERPDEEFASSYLGGEPEEYDVINENIVKAGTITAYNTLLAISNLSDNAQYEATKQMLDMPQFINYTLLNFYGANADWGVSKNWYLLRRRAPGETFKYLVWDGERVLEGPNDNRVGNSDVPGGLHTELLANAEYRLDFADRIHKHLFNGGVLTPEAVSARWMKRAREVDLAMIGESARWGDYRRDVHVRGTAYLFTYFDHFLPEQNRLLTQYFPVRTANLLNQLKTAGLYPNVNAPVFNQHGGRVASGFNLAMSGAGGTIYYTTNGTDPRVYGSGAVSASALAYSTEVAVNRSMTVKARVLSGATWSALNEATFTVEELVPPLRVTEIMYNPIGGDPYEFLELQNIGGLPLDIRGFSFSGITFGFPPNSILAPGQIVVLANDSSPAAFAERYPGVTPAGFWSGNLANGGERISLLDASGRTVISVTYDDEDGWPAAADGLGPSLEIIDPAGPPSDPTNWRASAGLNGTPGILSPPPALPDVRLNEVMAENVATITNGGLHSDWIELHNTGASEADVSDWSLTDGGDPRRYVFPSGTSIPAGGYLVVWCDTNIAAPGLHAGFALKKGGENVFLYDPHTNRVDAVSFGPQIADLTIGCVDASWQLCQPTPGGVNSPVALALLSSLRINEWLANALPGESDWVELFNSDGALPAALQNIHLGTSNTVFRIRSLSFIGPQGHLRLWADEEPGPDHLDFKLPASAGAIALSDTIGNEIDRVTYGPQIEGVSEGRLPDGEAVVVDFPATPSPGASNYVLAYTGPVLNEVMTRNRSALLGPGGQYPDWVELHNPDAVSFDLGGMRLSDDPADKAKWVIPAGTQIPAGGHLVIWCDGEQLASTSVGAGMNTGFSLSSSSGGVYLFNALGQPVDQVAYGHQVENLSIGLSGGEWHLLSTPTPGAANAAPAPLGSVMNLRFNEWMAASATGGDWFELYNRDPLPVSVSGLYLGDDPSVTGRTNTQAAPLSFIGGHGWMKWVADGSLSSGRDHVNFSLDAAGESLVLCASNLAVIDVVAFGIQAADVSQGRLPDGDSAIAAFPASPSPEASNYLPLTNVVINEVLTHTDPPLEDAIELHNPTAAPVEIGGWYLSDSESNFRKFRIPSGTTLPPGGFAVFYENQLNGGAGSLVPFNFDSAHGDSAILSEANANDDLTGFRAAVTFGAAPNGVSFGRHLTSAGEDFVAMSQRTFGQDSPANVTEFRTGGGLPNAYPLVGPVVISEIMYHPPDLAGDDNVSDEFIELHNAGPTNVLLFDPANPANTWRLRDAVDFDFPANTVILAGGRLLVVSFDPTTNAAALTAFRSRYGLTNAMLAVGPHRGKLANNGESLRLLRPDTPQQAPAPDAGFVPYVLVEQVDYADAAPWPASADGFGDSLQRVSGSLYGNEPTNWIAAAPDPGGPMVSDPDRDGDGMPNDWETDHGLNPDDPADALTDLDGDGLINREEYLAGTDPRDAQSTLRLEAAYDSSVSLRFIAAPGRSYSIQSRATVDQGQWTWLTDLTNTNPVSREITWPVPGTDSSRFFRIVTPKMPD